MRITQQTNYKGIKLYQLAVTTLVPINKNILIFLQSYVNFIGENHTADILINEAELQNRINPNWHIDFSNMNRILATLKNRNVDEALKWAEASENKVVKFCFVFTICILNI